MCGILILAAAVVVGLLYYFQRYLDPHRSEYEEGYQSARRWQAWQRGYDQGQRGSGCLVAILVVFLLIAFVMAQAGTA